MARKKSRLSPASRLAFDSRWQAIEASYGIHREALAEWDPRDTPFFRMQVRRMFADSGEKQTPHGLVWAMIVEIEDQEERGLLDAGTAYRQRKVLEEIRESLPHQSTKIKGTARAGFAATKAEIILASRSERVIDRRDAVLAAFAAADVRRGEMCSVRHKHVIISAGMMRQDVATDYSFAQVVRRGVPRKIPLPAWVRGVAARYIDARSEAMGGNDHGPLFNWHARRGVNAGSFKGENITTTALLYAFRRRGWVTPEQMRGCA